ncbi:hypothetical protein [Archangium sp.]|uniref:hypothetical protein n=1 Tax=Archangium sp. TaxID=1872627 RepID=UPI00389A2246
MKLDLPSFLLGCGAGASTLLFGKRLRPILLEVATVLYRFTESVVTRASMHQEDLSHLVAEARARAQTRPYAEPAADRKLAPV